MTSPKSKTVDPSTAVQTTPTAATAATGSATVPISPALAAGNVPTSSQKQVSPAASVNSTEKEESSSGGKTGSTLGRISSVEKQKRQKATTIPAAPVFAAHIQVLNTMLPDTSKIDAFDGSHFKRWQQRVTTLLDVLGVVYALTQPPPSDKDTPEFAAWDQANKVCKHVVCNTLVNKIFDTYFEVNEVHIIWNSLITKYCAEDADRQKFFVGNFYHSEMVDEKGIQEQINEFHKLVDDMKAKEIVLPDMFLAGILVDKLPPSWGAYKQSLKHKHKMLSLKELITHIIIEEANRKELKKAKDKEITSLANLVHDNSDRKGKSKSFSMFVNKDTNFKIKGRCYVCGKASHMAAHCR